ncbi:MAG: hypothetical protein JO332_10230, partial [Planctomycetaceae bacterium]|nr:hypothetical protein [Planctomycetaceae bacterium]
MTSPATDEEAVLVLAPGGRDARLVASILGEGGLRALILSTPAALLDRNPDEVGVLLLTSEALSEQQALDWAAKLRRQAAWSDLPILFLGYREAASGTATKVLHALKGTANVTILERPLQKATLRSSVEAALRARRRQYEIRNANVHLEGEVLKRTAELEEIVSDLQAFSYSVAHDLRAPIRTIHRYCELLKDEAENPAERDGYLNAIAKAAIGMDQLIQSLLSYGRVSREKLRTEILDPRILIESSLSGFQQEIQERKATVELGKEWPLVQADQVLLGQVLT